MMSRTQILLDPHLLRQARQRAAQLGVSLAEYVRRLVAQDLERPRPVAEPGLVFNLGDSGGSDVARDKDEMLGHALDSDRAREDRSS